jgi:hypothetical protein
MYSFMSVEVACALNHQGFFDITFCYFPITFRPPPNDPYGITPDDLRIALRYVRLLSQTADLLFTSKQSVSPGDSSVWTFGDTYISGKIDGRIPRYEGTSF